MKAGTYLICLICQGLCLGIVLLISQSHRSTYLAFPSSIPMCCDGLKLLPLHTKCVCFSKSWAAQKAHVGKLFELSTFFLHVTKKGLIFCKTTSYQRPPKLSAHERNLLYTLTILCLIDKHILSSLDNEVPAPPSGCAPQFVPKEQGLSISTSFTQINSL